MLKVNKTMFACMVHVREVWVVIHGRGVLNIAIYFQALLSGHLSLYYTKYDKRIDIVFHAQVWLYVNLWRSKNGHYDRILTNY